MITSAQYLFVMITRSHLETAMDKLKSTISIKRKESTTFKVIMAELAVWIGQMGCWQVAQEMALLLPGIRDQE